MVVDYIRIRATIGEGRHQAYGSERSLDGGGLIHLEYVFFGESPTECQDPSRVRVIGPSAAGS